MEEACVASVECLLIKVPTVSTTWTTILGTILTTTNISKICVSLAAEAEVSALFEVVKSQEEIQWTQPLTPMQIDNSTAIGIANNMIKQQ
jgi:hypothetical protein